jgi:hypothetical protein
MHCHLYLVCDVSATHGKLVRFIWLKHLGKLGSEVTQSLRQYIKAFIRVITIICVIMCLYKISYHFFTTFKKIRH